MSSFVATAIVASLAAMALPVAAWSNATQLRVQRTFEDGGAAMLVVVSLAIFAPILVMASGARALRGKPIPMYATMAIAGSPLVAGTIAYSVSTRLAHALTSTYSSDPLTTFRVVMQATSRATHAVALGAIASGLAFYAVVHGMGALASTVAPASDRRSRIASIASAAISVTWIAAWAGMSVTLRAVQEAPVVFSCVLASSVSIAIVAAVCARRAAAVAACDDVARASRFVGAIAIAMLAATLGAFLLDRAALMGTERRAIYALSVPYVDAGQRARIAMMWEKSTRDHALLAVVACAGSFASFVPALVGATRKAIQPSSRGAVASLATMAVLLATFAGARASAMAILRQPAERQSRAFVYPFELPAVDDADGLPSVDAAPIRLDDPATTLPRGLDATIAAGKNATVAELRTFLLHVARYDVATIPVSLLVTTRGGTGATSGDSGIRFDPDFAPFAGSRQKVLPFAMSFDDAASPRARAVFVAEGATVGELARLVFAQMGGTPDGPRVEVHVVGSRER